MGTEKINHLQIVIPAEIQHDIKATEDNIRTTVYSLIFEQNRT